MGRKTDGWATGTNKKHKKPGAKGKGKAKVPNGGPAVESEDVLARTLYPCRTCTRTFLPGSPYNTHALTCRAGVKAAREHAEKTRLAAQNVAEARVRAGVVPVVVVDDDGRFCALKFAQKSAANCGLVAEDDTWSDYDTNEFGGGGEDEEFGGHDEFDWGEDTGGTASKNTTPEVMDLDDDSDVPQPLPGQMETRYINGVEMECHLPSSVLEDPAWKNTRPPAPQVPYRPPPPVVKDKQGKKEKPVPAPNDTGIPGDGSNPWFPFQTWTDFKLAKSLKDLGASGADIDAFLKLIKDNRFDIEEMQILTAKKMEECLAEGRSLVRAPWKGEEITIAAEDGMDAKFVVWHQSIKDIVRDLAGRPEVAVHMNWVPRKYYRRLKSGKKRRVYHDFDSGDYWWKLHANVRKGDYVMFLHLYADASKIATFRGNKVWPVRIWLGNLPYKQRTDPSLVGSSLVGYVPIIEGIAGQKERKVLWFRRGRHELYHKAFKIILKDLIDEPKQGYCFAAGDDEPSRFGHMAIGCISMDLEELFKAFLGRGTKSNGPCVCCKVPRDRQKDITTEFEPRTMVEARAVQAEYTRLASIRKKGEAEELLKAHSTYRHTGAFSLLPQEDIHDAIGNDELHRDATGNWGRHAVSLVIIQAGDDGGKLLDLRIKAFPTFVGLRTFSDFTGKPWVDAGYFRALHAVLLFIAPGTLGVHEPHLLKLIRYWGIMHQYDGLHIQTEDTLRQMEVVISRIEILMKASPSVFLRLCDALTQHLIQSQRIAQLCKKSIDYPKFHNLGKVVARMKKLGAGMFTLTRVGEELHRDDHAFYKTSNKRDVTEQLVRQHENKAIMALIEGKADRRRLALNPPPPVKPKPRVLPGSDDKMEKRWPFPYFEEQKRDEDIYNNFALKIRTLLYDPSGALAHEHPRMSVMPVINDCTISNFHLLHIRFPRIDNWEEGKDIARCHEQFGEKKRPRYDSVIYNPSHVSLDAHDPEDTDISFGRLHSVFRLTRPDGVSHPPMALVQNFVVDGRDPHTWSLLGDEVETLNCSVIWCNSIIRACHTPPKANEEMARATKKNALDLQLEEGAFYINEFIDRDMYFRLKYAVDADIGDLEQTYFDEVAQENADFVPADDDEAEDELLGDGLDDVDLNEGCDQWT